MIQMEHLFDLTLQLGALASVGRNWAGERRVADIAGGVLTGAGLNGEVISGSDTQFLRADGVLEIDAAYVVRMQNGTHLRIINQGYRHGPVEVIDRLARGEPVAASEYFFRTVMRFETGAPELAEFNRTIALAQAERQANAVVFKVWKVL